MNSASQTLEILSSNRVFVRNFKATSVYETLYGSCTEYEISQNFVHFPPISAFFFLKYSWFLKAGLIKEDSVFLLELIGWFVMVVLVFFCLLFGFFLGFFFFVSYGRKGSGRRSSEKNHGFILTPSEFGMSMQFSLKLNVAGGLSPETLK